MKPVRHGARLIARVAADSLDARLALCFATIDPFPPMSIDGPARAPLTHG
ncbi:MAG TPA: hypothetical protein VL996_13995 [Methylocella sp.]|nr:hypothetical protein [Methylocella sp.]